MKKKGFTIVELLAVIVILGVLGSIATVAVGRYRAEVTKKELINLKGLISDSYDTYRNDSYTDYEVPEDEVEFTNQNGEYNKVKYSYFSDLSFDGERLTLKKLYGSKFKLVSKGILLANSDYLSSANEEKMVKDGTCVIKAVTDDDSDHLITDESGNEIHKFDKECVKDENGKPKPALEETLCIKLVVDGKVLIDDYSDENNLCKYFVGEDNE